MTREFVELPEFQSNWKDLGQSEEELRALQNFIAEKPDASRIIQGTAGLRKLRWGREEKQSGKRGGVRIIYLDVPEKGKNFFITVFGKDEKADLTEPEKAVLKALTKKLLSL